MTALLPEPEPLIDRRQVHKARDENVLISELWVIGPDRYGVRFRFPPDHPFFFEHDCDHVPGLALLEGARQTGLAVCHRFYGVPLEGYHFMLGGLTSSFTRYAELDAPVFGEVRVDDVQLRRGVPTSLVCHGAFLQFDRVIGEARGEWRILPDAVHDRMRGRR